LIIVCGEVNGREFNGAFESLYSVRLAYRTARPKTPESGGHDALA
jgi:hypothetical protein